MEALFCTIDVTKSYEVTEAVKVDMNPPRIDVNHEIKWETKQVYIPGNPYMPSRYEQRLEPKFVRTEKEVRNGPSRYENVYDGIIHAENHKITIFLSRSSPEDVENYLTENFTIGQEIKVWCLLGNYHTVRDKKGITQFVKMENGKSYTSIATMSVASACAIGYTIVNLLK